MNSNPKVQPQVAVVGCGAWGQNLIRNFSSLNALAVACDSAPEMLREARRIAPGVNVLNDVEAVLSRRDIPAVVFATPAETHAALARRALTLGKDVFVEKPMTVNAADAEALVTTAQEQERILMVGHILLHAPMMRKVKELIDAGDVGRVQHIAVKRAKQGKVRAYENVMWSFACHDIAAVLFLLDQEAAMAIQAVGRSFVQPSIEDDTHLHLRFANGASAHIHSSWYWPDNERHYIILGDRKWLKVDEVAGKITVHRKGIKPDLAIRDDGSYEVPYETTPPLQAECQHFLDCVATRSRPRSDGLNGLRVVRILEQATESLRMNRFSVPDSFQYAALPEPGGF